MKIFMIKITIAMIRQFFFITECPFKKNGNGSYIAITIVYANPEFSGWYLPWLIFIWLASAPCFAILIFIWKVSGAINRDEVFTIKTAKWIKTGAVLLFADAGFFFAGNILFLLLNMSHPGVLILSMVGNIFAIALALLAAVLSRYITKAAELQEVSEGMI